MRFFGEGPVDAQIFPEANENDALSALGHAIVGGVEDTVHNIVPKPLQPSRGVVLFQALQVSQPILPLKPYKIRIGELVNDVRKIGRERSTGKALHILEDEGLRLGFAHDTDSLCPHIAVIGLSPMFASKRKWLAGRPTTYELDLALMGPKVDIPDIALGGFGPMTDAPYI
jgi:hypothetical protein